MFSNQNSKDLEKINTDDNIVDESLKEYSNKLEIDDTNNNVPHKILNYRPDIDGLRTIAVGIVVLFHAWPEIFTGGFIGVDIFFVISGYLISGIIFKQCRKNNFTYSDFYSRRIKRIYPALIFVLVSVLLVGIKKLFARPLEIMTATLGASTIFAANLEILTAENDYFDPESTTNPVLHLWSLGVEEQFYIFWPLLLTFVIKRFETKTIHILSLYTVMSFILSIVCVFHDSQFAFYFPFCRFWQMSVGGIIAYLNTSIKNPILNDLLSMTSTIAILVTVWMIDENSLFPGFWALIPTLGAGFIIQAGSESFINKYILASKPFVMVGQISYSLYLWHWPLLVFSRLMYPEGSTSIFSSPSVMVMIAIVLSVLSYHIIENPFRENKRKMVPVLLFIAMILIGLMAAWVNFHAVELHENKIETLNEEQRKELITEMTPLPEDYITTANKHKIPNSSKNPHRKPPTVEKLTSLELKTFKPGRSRHETLFLEKNITEKSKYFIKNASETFHHYQISNEGQEKELFIIGDSHARCLLGRFQKLYEDSVQQKRQKNFPTIIGLIVEGSTFGPQHSAYSAYMEMIKKFKPERILIVYRWLSPRWSNSQNMRQAVKPNKTIEFEKMLKKFELAVKEITKIGIEVYISHVNIEDYYFNPERLMDEYGIIENNLKPVDLKLFRKKYERYFNILEVTAKKAGAKIVDLTDHICYKNKCELLTPNGYPIMEDNSHMNKLYAKYWAGAVDFLTKF